MESVSRIGKVRRGWELVKASWRVLLLDKELLSLPLLGVLASILCLIPFGVILVASATSGFRHMNGEWHTHMGYWAILFYLAIYIVLTTVSNFFSGAVVYGATQRFRGGDPTVRGSLAAVGRHFRPLLLFSILMATVGMALQAIEERVPFAGAIAVWLVNASWNVANFFAIPVIVLSDHQVHPLDATRESVQVVRKVWGEGVVAEAGINIIVVFALLAYMALTIGIGIGMSALFTAAHITAAWATPLIVAAILGLIIITLVFSVLGGIIKAALYHYATTGESPLAFNQDLLRAAMTPKKARKIFGWS